MEDFAGVASFGIAFAAGILSFLSPCILPLMPAYLSIISGVSVEELRAGEGTQSTVRRRALATAAMFVTGFSAVFIALGASATAVGGFLRGYRLVLGDFELGIAQLAGALIVVLGLHLAGWLPIQALYRTRQVDVTPSRPGLGSAFVIGAAFAFGWSPCVGPILGGILAIAGAQEGVTRGVALLSVYSAGLAVPFLLSAWSIAGLLRTIGRMRRYFRALEIGSGVLLIAVGLVILSDRMLLLNDWANRSFSGLAELILRLEDLLLR